VLRKGTAGRKGERSLDLTRNKKGVQESVDRGGEGGVLGRANERIEHSHRGIWKSLCMGGVKDNDLGERTGSISERKMGEEKGKSRL